MKPPPIVVLGAASGPRTEAFRAALARLGEAPAEFLSYQRFLGHPSLLAGMLQAGAILRFDSPDRELACLRALYEAGAGSADIAGFPVFTGPSLDRILHRRGPIGSPAQLAFGLQHALTLAATIARERGARLLADPGEVARSFDKSANAEHLDALGIPVPRRIGPVACFDDLIAKMRSERLGRVFVKLRFGSSAAGMTALALGPGGQIVAYTTAIAGDGGAACATRAVRRLAQHREVREIIDLLAPLGLHAEAWQPKAGVDGRSSDLRILTMNGEPVFNVMRLSPHPMTNLHLGGTRRPPDALRRRVGEAVWGALLQSCRAVARAYSACSMLGVDAAILAGDRRHVVFEVNAFGDHINGVTFRGCTPQEWQILQYRMRDAA